VGKGATGGGKRGKLEKLPTKGRSSKLYYRDKMRERLTKEETNTKDRFVKRGRLLGVI